MTVYTKTGDSGQTSLLSGQRVPKDYERVSAYGTVDEANAALGLAKSLTALAWAKNLIQQIQEELISLNADLATNTVQQDYLFRITPFHVTRLEALIDELEIKRIPQKYFVTPGTCSASAAIDLARTIVRRAERCVVTVKRTEFVSSALAHYLNRLSDLLFVLARCIEQEEIVAAVTAKVLSILNNKQNYFAEGENMLLARAKTVVLAAEYKATEIGIPMVIAVVDQGGNLVLQQRMDGSLLASIALALDKAYTAVSLKMPTAELAKLVLPGNLLYGLPAAGKGRYVTFGGGFPLTDQEIVVGGLGVSGGTVEEDMIVAEAGLTAW